MVFSSLEFLFIFLPIFLVLYYCLPQRYRNGLLFAGSILFYGIGEPTYLFLILYSVFANYLFGLLLEHCRDYPVRKKLVLIISLIHNFGILFYFKYMDFFSLSQTFPHLFNAGFRNSAETIRLRLQTIHSRNVKTGNRMLK